MVLLLMCLSNYVGWRIILFCCTCRDHCMPAQMLFLCSFLWHKMPFLSIFPDDLFLGGGEHRQKRAVMVQKVFNEGKHYWPLAPPSHFIFTGGIFRNILNLMSSQLMIIHMKSMWWNIEINSSAKNPNSDMLHAITQKHDNSCDICSVSSKSLNIRHK